jgi:hypothetical protein
VATYRVVGLRADIAGLTEHIRSELPHLKLDADPELMSADERRQAAAVLQEALGRLGPVPVAPPASDAKAIAGSAPPSDADRRARSA